MKSTYAKVKAAADLLATIGVAAVAIAILLQFIPSSEASPAASPPSPTVRAAVGDQLPPLAGIDYSSNRLTLVMAVQSSCRFCAQSMDFYKRLSQHQGRTARMIIVTGETMDTMTPYLQSHGLTPDGVSPGVDFPTLKVAGTPTLMLVDASGVVKNVWTGRLNADREREVLSAVSVPQ